MLQFFLLTYATTWTCFFAAAALSRGSDSFVPALLNLRTPLLFVGTFAPSLVAVGLLAREGGLGDVRVVLRRLLDGQVQARWYVFAVGYMAMLKLTAAVAHRVISGAWPPFGTTPWLVIAVAIVISTPVQAGEEVGWRGYALPRLTARFGLARASVLLGVIWGCWHLPLFFVQGLGNYGQSFPMFVLGSTGLSVAMAWLYGNTNGSLLLAILMHSAVNQTVGIVPTRLAAPGNPLTVIDTSLITLLFGAVFGFSVVYFLVRMSRSVAGRAGTREAIAV
ncbi:MAG: CPBP family intramembrane metalloprotease [Acidobacteriota bacterium]|nr:CPBP family intramembrane metalloprotease [Acidobacteriota bacterium]